MQCYILTCGGPTAPRRLQAMAEADRIGLSYQIVEGRTGEDPEVQALYSKTKNLLYRKRSLTAGEVACYFGHRLMWQRFLASDAPMALFCEDDFVSLDDARIQAILTDAEQGAPVDWDILKLEDHAPRQIIAERRRPGYVVVDYAYVATGFAAYIMTRRAAERMLARHRVFRPVDEDAWMSWEFGLRVRSVHPNPVVQRNGAVGGSLLEADRADRRRRNRLRSLWGGVLSIYWKVCGRLYQSLTRQRP